MVIDPLDCVVETYPEKYSGWIRKPDQFVRITHKPTNTVVCSEDRELKLFANASKAWQQLYSALAKPTINLRY